MFLDKNLRFHFTLHSSTDSTFRNNRLPYPYSSNTIILFLGPSGIGSKSLSLILRFTSRSIRIHQ